MFFGFFSLIIWLIKLPKQFFELQNNPVQRQQKLLTSLLPKIPKSITRTPANFINYHTIKCIKVVSINECIPTPQSLFENHIVKGALTAEIALTKCQNRKDDFEVSNNYKTNLVFEDPVHLVKCEHLMSEKCCVTEQWIDKKLESASKYIFVAIKPVKTYSCLLEDTGDWASAEFLGQTCPMFEKKENGKFQFLKESILYDKIIFEEKD